MKNFIKYLIVIFLLAASAAAQELNWTLAGEMRFPVAGASAFSFGDIIYLNGGYSGEIQSNVDWQQKFNTSQGVWKIVGNMHYERFGLYTGRINEFAYIFGGVSNNSSSGNSLESWEFIGSALTVIQDSSYQFNRILTTGAAVGNKIYLIGGNPFAANDSLDLSYIIEYDVLQQSITFSDDTSFAGASLPEQQMAAAIGSDIYIFGGVTNGISNKIYKFSTTTNTLKELKVTLLAPRAAGAAVYSEEFNSIYIFGGYNEDNLSLPTTEIFQVGGDNYFVNPGPPLNYSRKNLCAAVSGASIYAIGGFNDDGEVVPFVESLSNSVTGVEESELPAEYRLEQNYPNPFNPATKIKFAIPAGEFVRIIIYDILGNEITTLVNEIKQPGTYEVEFDGSALPSGIYYYRIYSGQFSDTKKMVLIK